MCVIWLIVCVTWIIVCVIVCVWYDSVCVWYDWLCVWYDSVCVWHDSLCVWHDLVCVWHDSLCSACALCSTMYDNVQCTSSSMYNEDDVIFVYTKMTMYVRHLRKCTMYVIFVYVQCTSSSYMYNVRHLRIQYTSSSYMYNVRHLRIQCTSSSYNAIFVCVRWCVWYDSLCVWYDWLRVWCECSAGALCSTM